MSAHIENRKDLCTDAIPDPPRDHRGSKANVKKPVVVEPEENSKCQDATPDSPRGYQDRKAKKPIVEEPDENNEGNKEETGHNSDDSSVYNEDVKWGKQKKNYYREEPMSNGFAGYPTGNSITITNASGPIHIGNNITQTFYMDNASRVRPPQVIPETDMVRALFEKTDLVGVKDIRYLKKYISISGFSDTARELGYHEDEIERFKYDPSNYQKPDEIIYQVLLDWIRNTTEKENGYDPTMGKLATALWQTGSQFAVYKWAGKVIR